MDQSTDGQTKGQDETQVLTSKWSAHPNVTITQAIRIKYDIGKYNVTLWMDEAVDNQIMHFNSLSPGQNGRHFADDSFIYIFVNETFCIFINISLKFVPMDPINNNPALI